MLKETLLKIVLISTAIAVAFVLTGCGKLPAAPSVWQCAWAGEPRAFHCVHSSSGDSMVIPAQDSEMNGAQCLSLSDFKAMSSWIETLKSIAEKKCK